MIPDDKYARLHKEPPDKQMDDPRVSSFWRRRAALMLGLYNPNAPWVDIMGQVEHREYQRDQSFAGQLALRHLRVEVERLVAKVERLTAERAAERTPLDAAVQALEALVAGGILTDAAYADLWPLLRATATAERTAHPDTARIC